jgi:integrase
MGPRGSDTIAREGSLGEIIRRTKGGRFIGFYLRWYEGGKRRQRASKQATYAEARRMLQAIEGRVARGLVGIEPPAPPAPTLRELTDRFLCEYSRPRLKDLAAYRVHARMALRRVLPALGERPADSIRPADVAKLRDALGERYAAGSVRMALTFLRTAYSWAVEAGIVAVNPCRGVEQPGPRALLEFLNKEDTRRLLQHARVHVPDRYPMIAMAIHTGMRKGELFGLRWRDLDLVSRRLDVERSYRGLPKGGKPRHLRLPAALVPILEAWQRRCPATPERLVFPVVRRGGAVRMGLPSDMLDLPELLAAAGGPELLRPWHALRHTMASHFIMQGGNILTLQKILGHSDLKQTLQYSHLAPDFLGEEMDRLRF